MKQLATLLMLLSLSIYAQSKVSYSQIGLMTQVPTDYIVNEKYDVEITRSVNQSYSFYQKNKIGQIDEVDGMNVTCMNQDDQGSLYISTGPELIYASVAILDGEVVLLNQFEINDTICDYSRDYNQSSYGPFFVTECENLFGEKGYEVFDTNLQISSSFKTDSKFVAPGVNKFFTFQDKVLGYYTFDEPNKFIKIADIPKGFEGAIRPMNDSKYVAYSQLYNYQIFDLEGNTSGNQEEAGRILTNIPERLFVLDQELDTIYEVIINEDLTTSRRYIEKLGSFSNFTEFYNAPNFYYQTIANKNFRVSLVFEGLNTYYTQEDAIFYYTTSSDEDYTLNTTLKANVRSFVSDRIKSLDNENSVQVFPNGFMTINENFEDFQATFSPVTSYYFTEGEIATTNIKLNKKNCSLSVIDLDESTTATYEFKKCPKIENDDIFETYDKILAYDRETITAYILHYPYIFKVTQKEVEFVLDEDFSGYDLQVYTTTDDEFHVIGKPVGEKYQTINKVFSTTDGKFIRHEKIEEFDAQIFISNNYAITVKQELGNNKHLLSRSDFRSMEEAMFKSIEGIESIKEVIQMNAVDTIILSEDNELFRCQHLENCENIVYDNALKNASISYRSSDSFNLKNGVNGFGTYTTFDLSKDEFSNVGIEEASEDDYYDFSDDSFDYTIV